MKGLFYNIRAYFSQASGLHHRARWLWRSQLWGSWKLSFANLLGFDDGRSEHRRASQYANPIQAPLTLEEVGGMVNIESKQRAITFLALSPWQRPNHFFLLEKRFENTDKFILISHFGIHKGGANNILLFYICKC